MRGPSAAGRPLTVTARNCGDEADDGVQVSDQVGCEVLLDGDKFGRMPTDEEVATAVGISFVSCGYLVSVAGTSPGRFGQTLTFVLHGDVAAWRASVHGGLLESGHFPANPVRGLPAMH